MTAAALEFHVAEAMAARLAALEGDGGAPLFADVLTAMDASALTGWPKTPAALVLPVSDEADEDTTRRVAQAPVQHFVRIGVAIIVRAPNDRTGKLGVDRTSPVLAQARRALAGWRLPEQREVLSFRRGRLVSAADGRVQWIDEYELRRVARAGVIDTDEGGGQT